MRLQRSSILLAMLLPACFVDVPQIDDGQFACESDEHCAEGFVCVRPGGAPTGSCVHRDDANDTSNQMCLEANPCGEMVCIPRTDGSEQPDCQECAEPGVDCVNGHACVRSGETGTAPVSSYCRPHCNMPGTSCGGGGVCADLPLAENETQRINACAFCEPACAGGRVCALRLGPAPMSYREAVYCDATGETMCNDAIDNDNDGATDCEDQQCKNVPSCIDPNATCATLGCTDGHVCAQRSDGGAECVPGCAGTVCANDPHQGACLVVPGYPQTDGTLHTVEICRTCTTTCNAQFCGRYSGDHTDTITTGCVPGWEELAGSATSSPAGSNYLPQGSGSLATNFSGDLVVAFITKHNSVDQVIARRYAGGNWIELDDDATPGITNNNDTQIKYETPALAIVEGVGKVAVAWTTFDAGNIPHVYFMERPASIWLQTQGRDASNTPVAAMSATGSGISGNVPALLPSLVRTDTDAFAVAYQGQQTSPGYVYVQLIENGTLRFLPSTGTAVTSSVQTADAMMRSAPMLAGQSESILHVVWTDAHGTSPLLGDVRMAFYDSNNSTWPGLATPAGSSRNAYTVINGMESGGNAVMACTPGGCGQRFVAWEGRETAAQTAPSIYLRRHTGNVFEGMSDIASQRVSTDAHGDAVRPVLALSNSGDPIVAFEGSGANGRRQIFVRFWDALSGTWRNLGPQGSNGISESTTHDSRDPRIAHGFTTTGSTIERTCVTWTGQPPGVSQDRLLMRCYTWPQ